MGASFVRVVVGNSFAKDRFKEVCLNDEVVEKFRIVAICTYTIRQKYMYMPFHDLKYL